MIKQARSPQEKKVLSYSKDRRNTVAESRSTAHKGISQSKAKAKRALRRAETVLAAASPVEGDDVDTFVAKTGRKSFRKIPDSPLVEYVTARLRGRKTAGMNSVEKPALLQAKGRRAGKPRPLTFNGSTGNGSLLGV